MKCVICLYKLLLDLPHKPIKLLESNITLKIKRCETPLSPSAMPCHFNPPPPRSISSSSGLAFTFSLPLPLQSISPLQNTNISNFNCKTTFSHSQVSHSKIKLVHVFVSCMTMNMKNRTKMQFKYFNLHHQCINQN